MNCKVMPSRAVCVVCLAVIWSAVLPADGRFTDVRLLVGKQQVRGSLVSDGKGRQLSFDANGTVSFQVPFDRIKSLVYERSAKPRYSAALLVAWPLIFTKSKQHYLTIQYTDASGEGRFQIVRLDKGNVQAALNTIEADTGIRVERSEER